MKFKTFTTEALLAADVNNLLMRQVVIQVDNDTERDSIPAPTEGMVVYNEAAGRHEYHDGTTWVPLIRSAPACALRMSANFNLGTSDAALPWDVEVSDTAGMHDNATNNTRIYATEAGLYEVAYSLYNGNTTGLGVAVGRTNGSTEITGSLMRAVGNASAGTMLKNTFAVTLDVGDYIEILVRHATATGVINGGDVGLGALVTMKLIG